MAATIEDVRIQVGDTTDPHLFTDLQVQTALDEAAADLTARGIDIDTPLGQRAQRLSAAIDLLDSFLARATGRPPAAISEDGKSVSFVDLTVQKANLEQKLDDLISRLTGCPFEALYDNY